MCGCSENVNMVGGGHTNKLMCLTLKELKTMASKKKIEGRSKLTTKSQLVAELSKKTKSK